MKYFFTLFFAIIFSSNAQAVKIDMYGKEKVGYEQPKYMVNINSNASNNISNLITLANHDNFPFSSYEQGSVYSAAIEKIAQKTGVYIVFVYDTKNYENRLQLFERGGRGVEAIFGVPQKHYPYSKNEYIYPAFYENKLYVITIKGDAVNIGAKEDLLKYRGVYVKKDNLSSFVTNELSGYKMQPVDDYASAFEMLFTKKIDYIVAGYYPSQIEAYKIGIRDYITYSKDAVWKNPMFLRINHKLFQNPKINSLKRYLKTEEFKTQRDSALEDVLEIYRKNTQGIVPPMYIGNKTEDTQSTDIE